MTPGPAGGLYVYISTNRGSVVALLDSSGKSRPGWPIAVDGTWCHLPTAAPDGSIRLVCGVYSDSGHRAYAFAPDGRPIAGWPVDLPGMPSAASPRIVGGDLYVMAFADGDPIAVRLVVVAPDGTLRTGSPYATQYPAHDWLAQLGPDGTAYLLTFPNEPPEAATANTEITAFDLGGVRQGWLARAKGWPNGLAFGADGRIFATEGQVDRRPSRILAFDHDGRALPNLTVELPVAATSAYIGAGPFAGAPPPVVADGGTSFLISEDDGTSVFGLDAAGQVIAGWPYRDAVGLQWSYSPPGDTGGSSRRLDPATGPGDVLYLLHPPRDAEIGGSVVAIGPDGRVRPGWPVVLERPGAVFESVVVAPDGTAYAVAVEPEAGGQYSATVLAIASDSTVRYSTTIIEP